MTEYEILAEQMDKRDVYFKALQDFNNIHGFIPKGHEMQFAMYQARGEKPWRQCKKIVKKLKKAAKKIATVDAKIKYIAGLHKKPEDEVRKLYQYLQDWKLILRQLDDKK